MDQLNEIASIDVKLHIPNTMSLPTYIISNCLNPYLIAKDNINVPIKIHTFLGVKCLLIHKGIKLLCIGKLTNVSRLAMLLLLILLLFRLMVIDKLNIINSNKLLLVSETYGIKV